MCAISAVKINMPQDKYIDIDDLKFHYIDWGGSGQAIVLLHGLASQAHIWDLTAPLLIDSFRVIALDQRGHGLTSKPDRGYDFAAVTNNLDRVLDKLQIEQPILIGHSWGGNVAVQYVADHPDRVKGLVLVDGGFLEFGNRVSWPEAEKMLEPPDLIGTPYVDMKSNLKMWLGTAWSPEAEAIILHNFEVRADNTIAPYMQKSNHMQVVRALWEHRPSELWARVRCPVLMIPAAMEPHSARDRLFLEAKQQNVARAEKLLAHSQTLWMNDTIHDIPLQRPLTLANAIKDFATKL
jgi:pimeloyl-ACP methyl ester carboxylesterase